MLHLFQIYLLFEFFEMYENHYCVVEFECPTKCVRIKLFYKPKTECPCLIHHLKFIFFS